MKTIEGIEKALTELPADQLAEFRAWFEVFDAGASTRGSTRTQKQADSTGLLNGPLPISALAVPVSCEALRQPALLGRL
jgi:hypothetical protein